MERVFMNLLTFSLFTKSVNEYSGHDEELDSPRVNTKRKVIGFFLTFFSFSIGGTEFSATLLTSVIMKCAVFCVLKAYFFTNYRLTANREAESTAILR